MPDRLPELFTDEAAPLTVVGLPYDGAVLGRKGCKDGPAGIRGAFRWSGTDDLDVKGDLAKGRVRDAGDLELQGSVRDVHAAAKAALVPLFGTSDVVVLGGDNSLSYATVAALADARRIGEGKLGLVVVDAHYDLRGYEGQPTSGTPFRRILEELPARPVRATTLVEVGIRPHANGASLAAYARDNGIEVVSRERVRRDGGAQVAAQVLARLRDCTHLYLSIDIDAFDQSIASGCSAPATDGLLLHEVFPLVEAMAQDVRCAGLEIMETAPGLDPTGNTVRTAAALFTRFVAVHATRA